MSGAPTSLAHEARRRELTVDQQERIAHCDTVENNIRHLLKFIEAGGGEINPVWLTHARSFMEIGMMCARRAITRQDFF
jgi:hypothetical protein